MNKLLYKNIGSKIRGFRKDKGLTQEQLAEKAGINAYYQGEVERGLKKVSVEVLLKIANALEVPLKEFF